MIKCNTEKPLKLPPIGAVIAFIIISNILFFGEKVNIKMHKNAKVKMH
jgi:hypothetical protein